MLGLEMMRRAHLVVGIGHFQKMPSDIDVVQMQAAKLQVGREVLELVVQNSGFQPVGRRVVVEVQVKEILVLLAVEVGQFILQPVDQ